MQINYAEAPVSSLSIQGLLSKITLADNERNQVDGTVEKIRKILSLGQAITPAANQYGQATPLHLEVDRCHALVVADPTPENAEAFHIAIIRERDASLTSESINSALRTAWSREVNSLQPIALGILDRVEALLDTESAKVRRTILEADEVFGAGGDVSMFDRRLIATRQSIGTERDRVCGQTASLAWLHENGFCGNPFQPTPTPAPKAVAVPDVALIRGRQKLEVELLVAD